VHEAPGLLNVPWESVLNATVPVGVLAVPVAVSDTVAVHVVAWPTVTEAGTHDIDVDVERCLTVRAKLPLLAWWPPLPPYEPPIVCVPELTADGL
jgi:hypothetical protein